jgi:hypothetical protein
LLYELHFDMLQVIANLDLNQFWELLPHSHTDPEINYFKYNIFVRKNLKDLNTFTIYINKYLMQILELNKSND